MQKYIGGLVKANTMLLMLQNELDKGSKTIYPDAMLARVHFQKDTITQYQAWHQYVTEMHQVDVVGLDFPQTPES